MYVSTWCSYQTLLPLWAALDSLSKTINTKKKNKNFYTENNPIPIWDPSSFTLVSLWMIKLINHRDICYTHNSWVTVFVGGKKDWLFWACACCVIVMFVVVSQPAPESLLQLLSARQVCKPSGGEQYTQLGSHATRSPLHWWWRSGPHGKWLNCH